MELAAIVSLAVLAFGAVAGLVYVLVRQAHAIVKMGNQLSANSDHQLERIKYEAGAESVGRYADAMRGAVRSQVDENFDMVIPNRGGLGGP